jgi:hypothetical protein
MATSSIKQTTVQAFKGHDHEAAGIRASGYVERSATSGIIAHAGGGQASAVALTTDLNRIATVGTAADSVKLPAAVAGRSIFVKNGAAANSANVYPATGDAINALGANAAYALAATKAALFVCTLAGQWDTILTA